MTTEVIPCMLPSDCAGAAMRRRLPALFGSADCAKWDALVRCIPTLRDRVLRQLATWVTILAGPSNHTSPDRAGLVRRKNCGDNDTRGERRTVNHNLKSERGPPNIPEKRQPLISTLHLYTALHQIEELVVTGGPREGERRTAYAHRVGLVRTRSVHSAIEARKGALCQRVQEVKWTVT